MSRGWASRGWSPSCCRSWTAGRSWSAGARAGACPTGRGSRSGRWGRSSRPKAGILESDPPEAAAAKIDAVIPEDAPDGPWLRARLRPLAGLAAPEASREENFAAWRAFIELLAEDGPTVLVVEDLHWADAALLDFLEHLADHAEGVPLLLVATARPELYERAPGWASSARNLAKVNLAPLGPAETARLIGNLLGSAVLPAEIQQAILDRCRRQPAVCRAVRAAAARPADPDPGRRRVAAGPGRGDPAAARGARADRRPAGHPARRAQTAAARRRGGRQGVLGRRRRRHGRTRRRPGAGGAARAGPQRTHPPGPPLVDGRPGRIRLHPRADPRGLLRPDPPRRARPAPPARRRLDRGHGRGTGRRPRRDPRRPLHHRPRPRPRRQRPPRTGSWPTARPAT